MKEVKRKRKKKNRKQPKQPQRMSTSIQDILPAETVEAIRQAVKPVDKKSKNRA